MYHNSGITCANSQNYQIYIFKCIVNQNLFKPIGGKRGRRRITVVDNLKRGSSYEKWKGKLMIEWSGGRCSDPAARQKINNNFYYLLDMNYPMKWMLKNQVIIMFLYYLFKKISFCEELTITLV